ncbi:hypothetical protein SRB5_26060 [Streptomyces sp. RB5]|uniref:CdiI immunity protein domain-containing protein n=1 Tax=Streptomyces smaragdinus TaxID=2585196 RepID=A0A7K0CHJ7_9ACTN|nr:contact-dependent growth inhibition system immunity protein [Streptomyces smaragdinus]MQY12472.1 hypothetical protein [Streptomyces smaragdinus]
MPLTSYEHDRRHGEMDQVLRAYAGQPADDTDEKPSTALTAYLRQTWHTRPWALATAEVQVREYARNPPGRLRAQVGEYYDLPDVGLPDERILGWLTVVADHIRRSVEEGVVPPPAVPETHWEWHARFPELGQLLGGWFSQDMPDEFADHDTALEDYRTSTDSHLVARVVGEVHALLALRLSESEYAVATAELGQEVEPPAAHAPSAWLLSIAERLRTA